MPFPGIASASANSPGRSSRGWEWRKPRNRRESSPHRRTGAGCWSLGSSYGFLFGGRGLVADPAQADVRLSAIQRVAELLKHRSHHVLVAVLVATRADADRHHSVDLLFHHPHGADDLLSALHVGL